MITGLILVSIIYLTMVLFETPGLIAKKDWRELKLFFAFWLFALCISILQVFRVKIPSPEKYITDIVEFIVRFF